MVELPFLICEAGLHGEGNVEYYIGIINNIRYWWSGWPRIVFKTQAWERGSPWHHRIVDLHGRDPLSDLTIADLITLKGVCCGVGIGFACTAHDLGSIDRVASVKPDYLKLGSMGAADPEMRAAAIATGLPLIMSNCLTPWEVSRTFHGQGIITLSGVSAYPANAMWSPGGGATGYTCHSVPSLITKHVMAAAHMASVIEVHVTNRDKRERPLPGDMCVALTLREFNVLSRSVGEIWKA